MMLDIKYRVLAAAFVFTTSLLPMASAATATPQPPSVFERKTELDGRGCSNIQWTVDRENLKLILSWKSTVGAEWTAFGITDFGTMKGADMAVVKFLADDGKFVIEDRYSKDVAKPELDVMQNLELLAADYDPEDARMHVVVQRDLDTCDSHDLAVAPHKQYIICASGVLDDTQAITYHGPTRSSGLVNFLVDEDLLFDQGVEAPPQNNTTFQLADGVLARGNVENSTSLFPVDIQMRGLTLDQNVVTHYMCSTFDIPSDFRFSSVEGVWGDGITPSGARINPTFHHMHLHYCEDADMVDADYQDGTPWDCLSQMPRCGIKVSYSRGTGKNAVPSGLHFDLPKGKYILQVHYENPFGVPIVNDRTGMRLWVQPPAVVTRTSSAGLLQFDSLLSSIQIPADPAQKEVEFQFQISADATRDYIPEDGVLVFGTLLHMHKLGSRASMDLIRDGKRVQTVYQSMSYDYDRQVPVWNRWRLMPGDAVVITCAFIPLTDQDVHGGFQTQDEMCSLHMGTAPEISNLGRSMGTLVKLNEPFLNSYMGPASVNSRMLNYSSYHYPPNPVDRSYDTRTGFGDNICHTMVRTKMQASSFRFSDAALVAQLIMMGAFLFVRLLSWKPVATKLGIETTDRRTKRNSIVYIGELLFSCVALPSAIVTLVKLYPDHGYYNAVNPDLYTFMLGLVAMQVVFYLLELFYRIQVRLSLILHHILTAGAMMIIFVFESQMYSDLVFKYGLILHFLAYTEQPLYIVLLLRNLGYRERNPQSFNRICKISVAIFVATRIVVVGLMIGVMAGSFDESSTAWRVRNESFAGWWDTKNTAVTPALVNAVMLVFMVGILCANFFAVKALWYMRTSTSRTEAISEDKSTTDDEEKIAYIAGEQVPPLPMETDSIKEESGDINEMADGVFKDNSIKEESGDSCEMTDEDGLFKDNN